MLHNGKWSKQNEKLTIAIRDSLISALLTRGCSVINDDTNLSEKTVEHLRGIAKAHGADFEIKDFRDVPLEECIKRDQKRPNYVGEKVIRRMYRDFLQPKVNPPAYHEKKSWCIVVDIDGTLALNTYRDIFDFEKCETDEPNEPVVHMVLSTQEHHTPDNIIICSGREEKYREQTERWLTKHLGNAWVRLLMRPTDDNRPDNIVKREIYEQHILPYFNVRYVVDDRRRVVDEIRSMGITVLQVAPGEF